MGGICTSQLWKDDIKDLVQAVLKAQTRELGEAKLIQAENIINKRSLTIASRTSEVSINAAQQKCCWKRLAILLYKVNQYQRCLELIQKHFFEDEDVSLMRRKGECLMYLMRHQQASEMFARALQKCNITDSKARAEITNSQGLNFQAQREYLNAAVTFQIAMAQDQTNPLFVCNAAYSYSRAGYLKMAFQQYIKCSVVIMKSNATRLPTSNINYIRQAIKRSNQVHQAMPRAIQKYQFSSDRGHRLAARYTNSDNQKMLQIGRKCQQQAEFIAKWQEAQQLVNLQGHERLFYMYIGMKISFEKAYSDALRCISTTVAYDPKSKQIASANNIFYFGVYDINHLSFHQNYTKTVQILSLRLAAECQEQLQAVNTLTIFRLLALQSKVKHEFNAFTKTKQQYPLKLYGQMVANNIVTKYVASGRVYENKRPSMFKPRELVLKLLQKGKDIIRSDCGIQEKQQK